MKVWGTILIVVVVAAALIMTLSFLATLLIARFARGYSEKVRKQYLRKIQDMLPGENCGGCGCETCAQYAHCVFYGKADTDRCVKGDLELSSKLEQCVAEFQKILEQDSDENGFRQI